MEVEFKYKIGQWLKRKEQFILDPNTDPCHLVIERMAHECPGGIQYSYGFRGFRPGTGEAFIYWLNEIELKAVEELKGDAV